MGSCGGGWEVRSYARREDANKMFSHANNCFQFSLRFFACFRYEQFFSLLWSRMQHLLDTCTCAQPAVKSNRTNTKKWYVFPFDSKKCVRTWNSMRIHRTFEPPMNAYATNRADDEWKSDKNWTPNEVISDELISDNRMCTQDCRYLLHRYYPMTRYPRPTDWLHTKNLFSIFAHIFRCDKTVIIFSCHSPDERESHECELARDKPLKCKERENESDKNGMWIKWLIAIAGSGNDDRDDDDFFFCD